MKSYWLLKSKIVIGNFFILTINYLIIIFLLYLKNNYI